MSDDVLRLSHHILYHTARSLAEANGEDPALVDEIHGDSLRKVLKAGDPSLTVDALAEGLPDEVDAVADDVLQGGDEPAEAGDPVDPTGDAGGDGGVDA